MADHIHEGDMDVVRCPQCSPGLAETETFRATYKRRDCCDSTEAQWHSRPCAVDGDQGPVGMNDWPPHEKLFAQREMTWTEMAERYPTRGDIEGKTREDLMVPVEPIVTPPSCPSCSSTEASTFFRGCVGTNQPHVWHQENGHPTPPKKLFSITNPEPPSYMGEMYFAHGQTVIKPDSAWVFGPTRVWSSSTGLRIREDTGSSDRTFENEARLNQRQPIQPKEYWF
jgi:hypothetical protein